jgi:hypothetical protein
VHKLLDLSGGAHFRFFSEMSYQLWGDMYPLNDLQHGLLRSGTSPPPCIPSLPRARIPRIPRIPPRNDDYLINFSFFKTKNNKINNIKPWGTLYIEGTQIHDMLLLSSNFHFFFPS